MHIIWLLFRRINSSLLCKLNILLAGIVNSFYICLNIYIMCIVYRAGSGFAKKGGRVSKLGGNWPLYPQNRLNLHDLAVKREALGPDRAHTWIRPWYTPCQWKVFWISVRATFAVVKHDCVYTDINIVKSIKKINLWEKNN